LTPLHQAAIYFSSNAMKKPRAQFECAILVDVVRPGKESDR